MSFISLTIQCDDEKRELLLAELSLFDFDAFEETPDGLLASCLSENWEETEVKGILDRYGVQYEVNQVEKVNWNEQWEKNYDPVVVDDRCVLRATFHEPRPDVPYEIIIDPKMSFGTGHHATTWQMLRYQLSLDHENKRVFDVGCGTGALAIMAHKRGASTVYAVDIDEWCVENSRENFSLNQCENISIELGGIDTVPVHPGFDIILANINKNILLEQMNDYQQRLVEGGILLLSGFYQEDIPDLSQLATQLKMTVIDQSVKDRWAMLVVKNV